MDTNGLIALAFLGATGNRTLGWLITYLLHSTAIIGVVWVIVHSPLGRSVSIRGRDLLFKSALLGGLVTSTLQAGFGLDPLGGTVRLFDRVRQSMFVVVRREEQVVRSAGRTDSLTISVASATAGDPAIEWQTWTVPAPPPEERLAALERLMSGGPPPFQIPVPPPPMSRGAMWLIAIWLLGAGAFAGWRAIARARLARRLGSRRDLAGTEANHVLHRLVERAHLTRPIRLTTSDCLASPAVLDRREICLPKRALSELRPEELEAILAHEVAHVVRRDTTWLTIASAIESIFFFQPLNRWVAGQVRDASELAADDWAVQQTQQPLVLARCLATVARWLTASPMASAAPAMLEGTGSPLVRRVRRLTNGGPERVRPMRALVPLGATLMTLSVTAFAPRVIVGAPVPAEFTREARLVVRHASDSMIVGRRVAAAEKDDVSIVLRSGGTGSATATQ